MLRNQTPSGSAFPAKNTRDLEVHLIPSCQSTCSYDSIKHNPQTPLTPIPSQRCLRVRAPMCTSPWGGWGGGVGWKRLLLHWRWRIEGLFFWILFTMQHEKTSTFQIFCSIFRCPVTVRTFSDLIPAGSPPATQAVNETFLILYSRKASKSFQVSLYRAAKKGGITVNEDWLNQRAATVWERRSTAAV